jgi:hypothetical protein
VYACVYVISLLVLNKYKMRVTIFLYYNLLAWNGGRGVSPTGTVAPYVAVALQNLVGARKRVKIFDKQCESGSTKRYVIFLTKLNSCGKCVTILIVYKLVVSTCLLQRLY